MMKFTVLPFVMLTVAASTNAQDDILLEMTSRAGLVAKVEAIEVVGGMMEEAGVEIWIATCKVLAPIKGDLEQGVKIKVDCSRLVWKEKEPVKFEKGKQYIVFLGADAPAGIYQMIDHWVGALPHNLHLFERTRTLAKETKEVQP